VAYLQDGVPVVADANGVAQGSFTDHTKFLLGGDNNVLGRAIVLHSPVAGAPKVAQGVIGLANPNTVGSISMLQYADAAASNEAGEGALARKINFASDNDMAVTGEPMVKGATCTFIRGGGVQGVYPDGFDQATSSTADPKDSTAKDTSGVGNLQGTVRFQERHSDDSPSGATVGVEWELSGLSHGKAYSWHVHTLGDTTRTDAMGVTGHYVGAGVNRAAVLAKLRGFKAGDTDKTYGAVSVSRPVSAVFEGIQSKYPGYTRTQYTPVGAVAVTQVADPMAAGAQTSVSPTLRLDYDLTGLEPSDRSATNKYAIVGGVHIHTGTSCASAGGHFFDADFVTSDPWATMYGPTDVSGGARGSFLIRSGHSAKQVAGRVVVLHDST
jgi:Cu/Zn superoxide dismutase